MALQNNDVLFIMERPLEGSRRAFSSALSEARMFLEVLKSFLRIFTYAFASECDYVHGREGGGCESSRKKGGCDATVGDKTYRSSEFANSARIKLITQRRSVGDKRGSTVLVDEW